MAADYVTLLGLVREFVDHLDRTALSDEEHDALQRARAAVEPSVPKNDPAVLHTWPEDQCCAKRLNKAARAGKLDDAKFFDCPSCDTRWLPTKVDSITRWEPQVVAVTLRFRRQSI